MKSPEPDRVAGIATRSLFRRIWLPVAILILVPTVDLATGHSSVFYPFLLLAPTLAAATATPLAILIIGGVSLGLRYWLASVDGYLGSEYTDLFETSTWIYVMATALSMYLAGSRIRRERALVAVSEVALAAQRAILLPPADEVGGLRLAVRYFAVAEEAELGGDLYLGLDTPFGLRLIIGDVLGKGLGAVRTAAITIGAFREAAYDEPELNAVARRVDASVTRNAPADRFVTALLVEFRPEHVALVHRGHEQPVMVRAHGSVHVLEPPDPGVPLGLGELDPDQPAEWVVPFGEGDLLLLMTDGFADARDAGGQNYRLVDRIVYLLGDGRLDKADPAAAVERLGDDLMRHVGTLRLTDDALVLGLARVLDSPPPEPE
ncbi:PP2C family protein-serine/threonine phosphatase [Streptomyces sp. SID3343]|uniref:PP2C family protein-serine/threonine phosphatase n=1 Tax=Streptomyces sp. SID3343 TaxID=2690260 RepID=UPI001367B295|nr:PP2C family protein-serine/threonine phosphatase [Streptomyces sp. SID3343]MYV97837.1 SpoIIE family protein phosphatase [Streptomyces sp. SID3343]